MRLVDEFVVTFGVWELARPYIHMIVDIGSRYLPNTELENKLIHKRHLLPSYPVFRFSQPRDQGQG